MRLHTTYVMCVAVLLGTMQSAAAQDASLTRAQAAYEKAAKFFGEGKFQEAADQFELAYEARPFGQFLFNIGASYEKLKNYEQAVIFYKKYVVSTPTPKDVAQVNKRIKVLEEEAKRIKTTTTPNPPVSSEAKALGEAGIRGLVVIESRPKDATIYLDSKKKEPLARTPWNGTLEGEHTIFIELKGYESVEKRFQPNPKQLTVLWFSLAKQDYLGWIDIKSNIPGANIYLDDKSAGVYGKTPFGGNLKPGKHKIWVTKEGYDEFYQEIEIVQGKTHAVTATLKGAPVGYLNFRGPGIQFTSIYIDGKLACPRGPCRKAVPAGDHKVQIKRSGHKTYTQRVAVRSKSETTVRATLVKSPSRGDAIVAYVLAAAFGGAGVFAGLKAKGLRDDLDKEIAAGLAVDNDDSRFLEGKIWAWGAITGYAIGGVALLTAVYYTFRDKGAPSRGSTDVRALAFEPVVSPTYAGMGLGVHW